MVHKVRCNVTGNIIYMTDKRYARMLAKYGDEEGIKSNYVSLLGKKIRDGRVDEPKAIKNRIKCHVIGRYQYITNQRMAAGIKKYGSWEELCKHYTCRAVAKLLREGKTEDEVREMNAKGLIP